MIWNLFLDDLRDPPNDGRKWKIARDYDRAIFLVKILGIPAHASFDHDLGLFSKDGKEFVKWLFEANMAENASALMTMTHYTHSANPVGKKNIDSYIESMRKWISENLIAE
jgi:hypothetical protein